MEDKVALNHNSNVALDRVVVGVITATSKTGLVYYARKIPHRFKAVALDTYCQTKAGAVTTSGVIVPGGNGIIVAGALTVHSTPEQLALALSRYMIGGAVVEKAAATAITFSAGHVVTASKYGAILVMINASGTVSTKVVAATQAYDTAAQAVSALPAVDSGKIKIAHIVIANNSGDWTANTDDLTDGSDLTTATITMTAALTPFVSAATFTSLTPVVGTVSATQSVVLGEKNDYVVLHYTSDGTGALTNGQATLIVRPYPLNGDGGRL